MIDALTAPTRSGKDCISADDRDHRATMTRAAASTVDRAYEYLRDRLVTFRVKPGARLNESEIAQDLTMSRAPVREALNRLISDGLVRFEPRRGFFSRRLSVSEMSDLFAVRCDLETGALDVAMDGGHAPALAAFLEPWQRESGEGCELDALVSSDERFHLDLAAVAGNAQRLRFLRNINDRIRFVRRINLETPERRRDSHREHADLLAAIAAGKGRAAQDILRRHLERSAAEMRLQVESALARIYADDVA